MMKKLSMYVWEDVLTDYTSGMICVLAHDMDEAYKVLAEKCGEDSYEYKEARSSPLKVYDEPAAVYVWGGG